MDDILDVILLLKPFRLRLEKNECVQVVRVFILISFFFSTFLSAQIALEFQGGEPGDTWVYNSTGASSVAQAEALLAPNKKTGTKSLVVGGNTSGGSCIEGGSGNGPSTLREFTFTSIDLSSSTNYVRTLTFSWGNRFPECVGTGWDAGEDLIFTPYHDGVAQAPITLASGATNATFSIAANQATYSIPTCVQFFYFTVGIMTNRKDELLFIDDVRLTTPSLNQTVPVPSAIAGATSVCVGESQTISVNANPATFYTWSGLPASASFTTPNGTLTSNSMGINWGTTPPGSYTISVTPTMQYCGVMQAGVAKSITITVGTGPLVTVTPPSTICVGESIVLSASGATTYTWDNGLGVGNGFSVAPTVTTTYNVVGNSGNCISSPASVTVTVVAAPAISFVASESIICLNETATITASGATTYTWGANPSIVSTNGNTITVNPSVNTTFSVQGAIGTCVGTAQITISVESAPIINAGSDVSVCSNAPVTLVASGGSNYQWSQGIQNGVPFLATSSQTYSVSGTSPNGCVGSDEVVVTVVPGPVPSFESNQQTGCFPLTVDFTSTSVGGNEFQWNFGDGTTSVMQNPSHTFTLQNCHAVSLTITSINGCQATLTLQDYVCPDEQPVAAFSVNPGELDLANPTVGIVNMSSNAATYLWDFGDQTTSTAVNPSHTFPATSALNYIIKLWAFSEGGCVDSTFVILPITEEEIFYIPNVFTPDGNELNQVFQPVITSGIDVFKYNLRIFNRWGELIFETLDPKIGWDGVSTAGTIVPDGIYTWQIIYNRKNSDDRKSIEGFVTLVR